MGQQIAPTPTNNTAVVVLAVQHSAGGHDLTPSGQAGQHERLRVDWWCGSIIGRCCQAASAASSPRPKLEEVVKEGEVGQLDLKTFKMAATRPPIVLILAVEQPQHSR